MQQRIETLLKLEEEQEKSKWKFTKHQALVKRWLYRQSVGNKYFHVGDLALSGTKHMKKMEITLNSKSSG
jgi:hypothetical protein